MDATKIRLSPDEAALVIRADWILTKNGIIEKTRQLLAALQTEQQALLSAYGKELPEVMLHSSPKISKGENYKGLPYLVLDYPRQFNKEDILTIRTLFWWGNFFSVTLHLSGMYKEAHEKKIIASFESLKANEFSLCINEDPWEHHFETDNYVSLDRFSSAVFEQMIYKKDFIKCSKKIPLHQWNEAEKKLLEMFIQLIGTLTDQLPKR